jgi:hypothetical protein
MLNWSTALRPRRSMPGFVAVAAMAVGVHARAADYCVGTETELRNALADAESNGDPNNNIAIKEGTITITSSSPGTAGSDGPSYNDPSGASTLTIYGRRNSTCTGPGGDSILDGAYNTNLLWINNANDVYVGSLTFAHGDSKTSTSGASALYVNGDYVNVELNTFIANRSPSSTTLAAISSSYLVLETNLVIANQALGTASGYLQSGPYGFGYVVGNTIIGNTSTDTSGLVVPYGLWLDGNKKFYVSNNILWGAVSSSMLATHDLYSTSVVELHNNDIQAYAGYPWDVASSGNLSVSPDFNGFFSVSLAPTSPLVNAGLDNPPCGNAIPGCSYYDLGGQSRVIGRHVDIGAYESEVLFRNGFQ